MRSLRSYKNNNNITNSTNYSSLSPATIEANNKAAEILRILNNYELSNLPREEKTPTKFSRFPSIPIPPQEKVETEAKPETKPEAKKKREKNSYMKGTFSSQHRKLSLGGFDHTEFKISSARQRRRSNFDEIGRRRIHQIQKRIHQIQN